MRSRMQKKKELSEEQLEIVEAKDFFDRISPGIIRFYTDHYICGNSFRCVWAVTEYPPSTEETAILAHLADRNGVTLRIYDRLVTAAEQRKIVQQAMRTDIALSTRFSVLNICSSFSRLKRTANKNCLAVDISICISSRKS